MYLVLIYLKTLQVWMIHCLVLIFLPHGLSVISEWTLGQSLAHKILISFSLQQGFKKIYQILN